MEGMTHAVTGPAVPNTEALAGTAQKQVVICVLEVLLKQVVVDVLSGELGTDAVEPQGFQFQHYERAGSVLGQRLVHPQPDLGSGYRVARQYMRTN